MLDIKTEAQLLQFLGLTNKKIADLIAGSDSVSMDDRLKLYAVENHVSAILDYSDNPFAETVIKGSWRIIRSIDEQYGFGVFQSRR